MCSVTGWSFAGCRSHAADLVARILHRVAFVLVRWCPRQDWNLRPSAPEVSGAHQGPQGREATEPVDFHRQPAHGVARKSNETAV